MKIRTINPFRDANAFWLGLDEPGYRRKVFKIVDRELVNSEFMVAGLTIFDPGESSSVHPTAVMMATSSVAQTRSISRSESSRAKFFCRASNT